MSSEHKFHEESLFLDEERSLSQELLQRDLLMSGILRYLDGRELRVKPSKLVIWC